MHVMIEELTDLRRVHDWHRTDNFIGEMIDDTFVLDVLYISGNVSRT